MSTVRIATWNIRAGGGKRTGQIAKALCEVGADLLVLTEYRQVSGLNLLRLLDPLSYVCEPNLEGSGTSLNRVCLLSRHPTRVLTPPCAPTSNHRWASVTVPAIGLTVLGVHVPNQTEVWNKREFWKCVESFAEAHIGTKTVIIGDLNTALDEDCQGDPIREAVYMKRLLKAGWVDAWRQCNKDVSEYSWFSHRANGFRLDHCLVSPMLAGSVVSSSMRHDVRNERLSDHSMLVVDLELD